jgi:DNA-binding beta-propeller fold protein YncE
VLGVLFLGPLSGFAQSGQSSDQNGDGVVNLEDLILFSDRKLKEDWQTIDWCLWLLDSGKYQKHYGELLAFIRDYFGCAVDPLAVLNANNYPTRLAWGPDGRLYVSDAKAGSVFIYERQPELTLVGELKELSKPLGVAIGPDGNLYVGLNGRDNVEIYGLDGSLIGTIGQGTIQMPNDLTFDPAGYLYVADSQAKTVRVYDPMTGAALASIGDGELRFPVAVEIAAGELFVADQGDFMVKVFDLQGNLLRSLGSKVSSGMMGYKWTGKFIRLQSLAIDATGRLHAADCHMGIIQILDPSSGTYLSSYGSKGSDPGELNLPLDIALNGSGEVAVANTLNQRVEILPAPPAP